MWAHSLELTLKYSTRCPADALFQATVYFTALTEHNSPSTARFHSDCNMSESYIDVYTYGHQVPEEQSVTNNLIAMAYKAALASDLYPKQLFIRCVHLHSHLESSPSTYHYVLPHIGGVSIIQQGFRANTSRRRITSLSRTRMKAMFEKKHTSPSTHILMEGQTTF